jgi:hypothetical protein
MAKTKGHARRVNLGGWRGRSGDRARLGSKRSSIQPAKVAHASVSKATMASRSLTLGSVKIDKPSNAPQPAIAVTRLVGCSQSDAGLALTGSVSAAILRANVVLASLSIV